MAPFSQIDQIIAEFYTKCLHILLESRIPFISQARDSPASSSASSSSHGGLRSRDRWFNLVLGDCPAAYEQSEPWRRNPTEPMIVDVLLVRTPVYPASKEDAEDYGTVLERWIITHERVRERTARGLNLEVAGIYKRTVILMRSLYASVRTLPAHRLFHLASSSSQSRSFSLAYRVSVCPIQIPSSEEMYMEVRRFTPVETPSGRLSISVAYRHTTAVTALEVTPPILPRIITDYVGSPTTDPLRRVPSESLTGSVPSGGISGRRGVHVVSLPTSVPGSSAGIGRRHSWGGGLNKLQPTLLPPSYSPSRSYKSGRSPSPSDYRQSSPIAIQHRRGSPPVPPSSFSPSPPATTSHSLESSLRYGTERQRSLPVSIPKMSGLRSALPPPSPRRSFEHHPHHQVPTSNLATGPRLSSAALTEALLSASPQQDEGLPSGVKRSLYSSPRVSPSRSSSKVHDDDDEEFACPFAVDEDDVELHSRTGSPSSRNRQATNPCEASGGPKSAVGALFRALKSAPLLQNRSPSGDASGPSSFPGVFPSSQSRPIPGAKFQRQRSLETRWRTMGEALNELEGYKDMRNFFLTRQQQQQQRQGGRKCTEKHLPSASSSSRGE